MKNPVGVILALGGLALAIYGITLFGDSGASASVLGVELDVQDNDMRMQAYMFIALGVAALLGGVYAMRKK